MNGAGQPAGVPEALRVSVTEIGEYIRHRSCHRRFKLGFNRRREARRLPFAERLFNDLDPVLQEAGRQREEEWERSLQQQGYEDAITPARKEGEDRPRWEDFVAGLQGIARDRLAYAREIVVEATIGAFVVYGRIDFVVLLWANGRPRLRLVECKASRRDRTYQRVQIGLYGMIVRRLLAHGPVMVGGVPLGPENVECVVARIDENTNEGQAILTLPPFDLAQEEADLLRLLSENGALRRIVRDPLDRLDYRLDGKCDACVFNVDCLPESARLRKLELIGMEPSSARALRASGTITLDQLADLDLAGEAAGAVRALPGFSSSLLVLQRQARARRVTLPGGRDFDDHEVEPLPNYPQSQLPEHEIGGRRVVRVYLTVHYDYVENRIGALAAHVTASDHKLHTGFEQVDGRWRPRAELVERQETARDANDRPVYVEREVHGVDIAHHKASPWTGRYPEDTGSERENLQGFFHELVDAIAEVAGDADRVPVHFYVWSRSEMAQLVEACSRVGSGLLGHLRELLGCREPLEQLIYSCLEDEVHNRFALGWTSRGLVVVTSLSWFGERYLWRRVINGVPVDLDRAFTQDIFDFKTDLWLTPAGEWTDETTPGAQKHKFEIRSRFFDTLTAPYWHAVWGTLPDPAVQPPGRQRVANAIRRYNQAAQRGRFRAYLRARAHALRWIEERIRFKNADIQKPLLTIAELIQFSLGIDNTAEAAIDFLRIDHHVAGTDWIAAHLVPPAYRVATGRTLPIADVRSLGRGVLEARIDVTGYDMGLDALQGNCTIGPDSFVRMTPCDPDSTRGQTVAQLLRLGSTCVVEQLDWQTRAVRLKVVPNPHADLYRFQSYGQQNPGLVSDRATLDESPSDFVAGRVEDRLQARRTHHACNWLNPLQPQIPPQVPLDAAARATYEQLLANLTLPNGRHLETEQIRVCAAGLGTRIQLLQGPPGTGKTTTTATATLVRAIARCQPGSVVLVAANTHAAVNNVLDWIARVLPCVRAAANPLGVAVPEIRLAKVESGSDRVYPPQEQMPTLNASACVRAVQRLAQGAVAVVGGTVGSLLKAAENLDGSAAFGRAAGGFQVAMLIVDEASMMVFPHFLALATIVSPTGEIMLAGDHRQLAPIIAHDWEREDRPPVVLYQPYASAYDAVRNVAQMVPADQVSVTALSYSFRLPPVIRDLIARLYRLDAIELAGRPQDAAPPPAAPDVPLWGRVWGANGGLYLVVHSEQESVHSNRTEARIIELIMQGAHALPANSTAIVTPHRAQRNLLQQRLAGLRVPGGPVGLVDTVEKLQGGERPNIIVSGTESDPASIASRVDFILDLNRSNVAFSRAQERLIVVCAETLLNHIPAEVEQYQDTMLWKSLREVCSELVGEIEVDGHQVRVYTPPMATVLQDGAPAENAPA